MNQFDTMKKETMRRIWTIYLMRKAAGRTALKVYALAALVWFQSLKISIPDILANMPKDDPVSFYRFFSYAFLNTHTAVQVATLSILALLMLTLWDIIPRHRERFS